MEDWTEASLTKLSVKELKSLARRSNVNPNFRKAELVKALISNVNDHAERSETHESQKSRRTTRSRVSVFQVSDETSDIVRESKAKPKDLKDDINAAAKDSNKNKRTKKKNRSTENINIDTSEMFQLVSSIKLASKPLLEITNNGKVRHDQNEEGEDSPSNKTKQKKKKNVEAILPTNNEGVGKDISVLNSCSQNEGDKQTDCDLNGTFIVEVMGNPSENVTGNSQERKRCEDKKPSEILGLSLYRLNQCDTKFIVNDKIEERHLSVAGNEIEPRKTKRGKKLRDKSLLGNNTSTENTAVQSESSQTLDTCSQGVHDNSCDKRKSKDPFNSEKGKEESGRKSEIPKLELQGSSPTVSLASKTRRKKGIRGKEDSTGNEIKQNESNITSNRTDIMSETQAVSKSARNEPMNDFPKKRKRKNSPPHQNTGDYFESIVSQEKQNNLKRKKDAEVVDGNNVSSSMETKPKRGRKRKQDSSPEIKFTETPKLLSEEPGPSSNSTGTSLNSCSVDEPTSVIEINRKVKKNQSIDLSKSNIISKDDQDDSIIEGQTGQNSIQAPIRSSTFILSPSGETEEATMPVPVPLRDSTFILTNSGDKGSQRRSLRFSPGSTNGKKMTHFQNEDKLGKSIGKRIMQNSMKGDEKSFKKEPGSALKKSIAKGTPGSVFKKRAGSKLPNFKKIHQQLFKNMESLSENKKRQLDRAQGLLQSPMVPRCAMLSPRPTKDTVAEREPPKKIHNAKLRTPLPPARTSLVAPKATETPSRSSVVPSRASAAPSPLARNLKTPIASQTPPASRKPGPVASSVNRFGFRKPVKKEEATNIVGKKMPPVNVDQKKEQQRNLLKGVRMNKRFMLQMQMRQASKEGNK